MTQSKMNPMDKVIGLHISLSYSDGVIVNMTRRKAMDYIRTFEHMKTCEDMEDTFVIVSSHHKSTEAFQIDEIESMEIIAYDTLQ